LSSVRGAFSEDLEQLRIQVELMALRVDQSITWATRVIELGDGDAAAELLASDDEIDQMHVSLLERCYELLVREGPVASDFRLVVSVIRALDSLERIGDLCLRVAKTVDDQPLVAQHPEVHRVAIELARKVQRDFRLMQSAWAQSSLEPLERLGTRGDPDREPAGTRGEDDSMALDGPEQLASAMVSRILDLSGPGAVRAGVSAFVICRSLDRIEDHTQVLAARLKYLVTGDPSHLADEVA
jgi:phosphate transport system protein